MSVHTRAPLRIDFAGGWTDVPAFADRHGGVVVNAAISCYVHVDFLPGGGTIRLHAEDRKEHVTIPAPHAIRYDGQLDLHKAALNMLPVTGGIEILSRSDAPSGSGLGASGALDVALLAGLARLRGDEYAPDELAELGFMLETGELGLAGGRQDQYAAALGGFHEFTFRDGAVHVRRLALDAEAAASLAQHLVLAYTGQSHFSPATHDRVWDAFAQAEAGVSEALVTLRDVAPPAAAALEAGAWRQLAELVDTNWVAQQRLDATIATPKIRGLEERARRAGAWGLKATGAGAGGCLVLLCPPERRAAVAEALHTGGAEILDVGFDFEGVTLREEEEPAGHQ